MRRTVFIAILAVLIAVFQAGFLSALPAPVSSVDLPLLLVVGLITAFRFGDATVAALAAGVVADALSSLPDGSRTITLAIVCAVTVFLFTRVFTHHSWQGNIALHLGAFALSGTTLALLRTLRAAFAGLPTFAADGPLPWWQDAWRAGLAQLVVLLLVMLAGAAFRAAFGRRFQFRSYAR